MTGGGRGSALRGAGPPILSVRDVTVRFGGIVALERVSFQVEAGQIVGLIGPNGAGKTTLFNCLSRLYTPESGVLEFLGRPIHDAAPHRIPLLGISRTFQNLALFPTLSVLQNVMVGAHCRRAPRGVGPEPADRHAVVHNASGKPVMEALLEVRPVHQGALDEASARIEPAVVSRRALPTAVRVRFPRDVRTGLRPHARRVAIPLEDGHRVRVHDDPGADAGELGRSLQHRRLHPALHQLPRRGQPREATADDHRPERHQPAGRPDPPEAARQKWNAFSGSARSMWTRSGPTASTLATMVIISSAANVSATASMN